MPEAERVTGNSSAAEMNQPGEHWQRESTYEGYPPLAWEQGNGHRPLCKSTRATRHRARGAYGSPPDHPHRVVVIGGGFAGLHAVRGLRKAEVEVTLVDRRNFHLFQPLLYQVASGALSPGEIAYPLRRLLARQPNARVLMADVAAIDLPARRVRLRPQPGGVGAVELPYDWLIVATGAGHSYFGHDAWARHAPGLKTL